MRGSPMGLEGTMVAIPKFYFPDPPVRRCDEHVEANFVSWGRLSGSSAAVQVSSRSGSQCAGDGDAEVHHGRLGGNGIGLIAGERHDNRPVGAGVEDPHVMQYPVE